MLETACKKAEKNESESQGLSTKVSSKEAHEYGGAHQAGAPGTPKKSLWREA